MAKTEFSIIIPCFNSRRRLFQTLTSVKQTLFCDFEIIVVDDASTDGSIDFARKELEGFECISKFLRFEANKGVSAARNLGFMEAKGRFVSFLDSDDLISPFFMQKAVEALERAGGDLWGCGYDVLDEEGVMIQRRRPIVSRRPNWPLDYLKGYMKLHLCGTVYRREFLLRTGIMFDPLHIFAEDQGYLIRILSRTQKVIINPKPFYTYVQHAKQKTRLGRFNDIFHNEIMVFKNLLEDPVIQNNKPLSRWIEQVEVPRITLSFLKNLARSADRENFRSTLQDRTIRERLVNMECLDRRMLDDYLKCQLLLRRPDWFFYFYSGTSTIS